MNEKVQNQKVEVPETQAMNDRDYLSVVLESLKNMSNNLSVASNEASNQKLYQQEYALFEETKRAARELYELMFQYGWYTLEKAETQKIDQKYQELTQKMSQLG